MVEEVPRQYICNSTNLIYSKGYIGLELDDLNIPETFEFNGNKLTKKPTLHVSLVCVKKILAEYGDKIPGLEQKILDLFCKHIQSNPIEFSSYNQEFRFVEEDEKKTIIVMCGVNNLNSFFELLNKELNLSIPIQPTHVTCYTLQPNIGIGLTNNQMIEELSSDITESLDEELKSNF